MLTAYALLYHALKEEFDIILDENTLRSTGKGKPYIVNSSLSFSLAHSDARVVCALGSGTLGCDIEKIRIIDFSSLAKYLTDYEQAVLNNAPAREKADIFYRIWTLKESYGKALGFGLPQALKEFEIPICIKGRGAFTGKDRFLWNYLLQNTEDYMIGVVSQQKIDPDFQYVDSGVISRDICYH